PTRRSADRSVKAQVALPPGVKLVVHITEPTAVKLEGTLSLTVKLAPGASPVKLPVRVIVVPGPLPPTSTVEPLTPPLPVSEKVKLPVPPSTCLVTTIWPLAALVKAQSVLI